MLFGGYTADGYSNEVFLIDLVSNLWAKPVVTGKLPPGMDGFSMNLVHRNVWVYGGYENTGPSAALYVLDMGSMHWSQATFTGLVPNPRSGHSAVLHGDNLIVVGGCDYRTNTCFDQTMLLDVTMLAWTVLPNPEPSWMTARA